MMNTQENKLNLVKMRILLWIIGLTRKNRISNNFKRKKKCRVMPIVEKIVNLVLDSLVQACNEQTCTDPSNESTSDGVEQLEVTIDQTIDKIKILNGLSLKMIENVC